MSPKAKSYNFNNEFDIDKLFTKAGGPTVTNEMIADVVRDRKKYIERHRIPKKTKGEYRYIVEPLGPYKIILKGILQNVLHRFYKADKAAFGCVPHRSNKQGSKRHVGAIQIFHTDLKNAFDNLHGALLRRSVCGNTKLCSQCHRRYQMLKNECLPRIGNQKCEQFNSGKEDNETIIDPKTMTGSLSDWLIELCTLWDKKRKIRYTPQGFPTSPFLLNIAMRTWFDVRMTELVKDHKMTYSRYVDDIVVTSDDRRDKKEWDEVKKYTFDLIYSLNSDLPKNDIRMKPNYRKTWVKSRKTRIEVFGIVVHEKPNIRIYKRMSLRAAIHKWEIKCGKRKDLDPKAKGKVPRKIFTHLFGLATYYAFVNPALKKYVRRLKKLPIGS